MTDKKALAAPLYGATFPQAVMRFFAKYATFSGRASRSEYWWWVLANFLVVVAFNLTGSLAGEEFDTVSVNLLSPFSPGPTSPITTVTGALFLIYTLGTLLPALALTWRRLHDVDRSGAWFFIVFIPLAGAMVLLVFPLLSQRPGGSRFDANPQPA